MNRISEESRTARNLAIIRVAGVAVLGIALLAQGCSHPCSRRIAQARSSQCTSADRSPPAETSSHVSGDAVDIGPFDAPYWLTQYGDQYGLCQTYSNESWHFELRPEAVSDGCPAPYLDPTEDPRLQ